MSLTPVAKIESFGLAPSYPEAVAAIRTEHGRGASHFVAEQLDLGLRQAQRYLSAQPPQARRPEVVALAPLLRVVEVRLRRTIGTTKGTIEVDYSPTGRHRRIPALDATAGLSRYLEEAADQAGAGERYLAATEFEQFVLLGYGGGVMPEEMSIVGYIEGIDLVLSDGGALTSSSSADDEPDFDEPDTTDIPYF